MADFETMSTEEYKEMKDKERNEVFEMLSDSTQKLMNKEEFIKYLDLQAQFFTQTTSNVLLIKEQSPGAAWIKTADEWNKHGIFINKGEKGIKVLRAKLYQKSDGSIGTGFEVGKVFDIKQTSAADRPVSTREYPNLLESLMHRAPCMVAVIIDVPDGGNAYYDHDQEAIFVKEGLGKEECFLALARELSCYVNNPEKTISTLSEDELSDIADVLEYVDDEVKTEKHFYTTGIGCDRDHAREEFDITKRRFGKEGGIVAAHGYQSFEEESITPEEAHAIGVELARELWGGRFQVLVSTHLNTDHIHNHFVINSVSYKDGKRFHFCTDRYLEMREASDRLCRAHGLSVIEDPKGKGKSTYLSRLEKAGMPTRYTVARQAIDEAISRSMNIEEFKAELRQMGYRYQLSPNRKYWTVTIPGWSKPIRIHQLGEEYTKDRVLDRIYENDESTSQSRRKVKYEFHPNYYRMTARIHKINHILLFFSVKSIHYFFRCVINEVFIRIVCPICHIVLLPHNIFSIIVCLGKNAIAIKKVLAADNG